MSVVHKKISEFTDVITGGTPSTSKPEYWDGNIPWLNSGILNDGDVYRPSKFVTELGLKNSAAKLMPPNTVLIALTGATTGQVGYLQIEASANQSVTGILPSKEHHPRYLYYYLMTKKQKIQGDAFGGAQPHINQQYVKDFTIPLPPLDDQIRIATVLTRAERLIAKRKESIKALDELLKSTFLEMFGDGVGTITSLGEVIEIQNGQVHPKEEPYSEMYHVGGANIESETGKLMNLQKAKFENLISGKYLFTSEHILYSKIRPYLNKVAMPDFTGICSADIYPIKPKSNHINKYFLRYILMSKQFLAYADNNSDRANIPKINRKALIQYSFSLPPLPLQNQFAAIVEKVESIKAKQAQSLAELENLYASLSQRAFKGELDLSGVGVERSLT